MDTGYGPHNLSVTERTVKLTNPPYSLTASEQRDLEARLQKRQIKEFMSVRSSQSICHMPIPSPLPA
jgi:hypothetical protein